MPIRMKMQVAVVRNVFDELRSIGPSFSGGICSVPLGKMESFQWKMGNTCGRDVCDDHVGDEDAERQRGQGQIEATQADAGRAMRPPTTAVTAMPSRSPPERDPLGGAGP